MSSNRLIYDECEKSKQSNIDKNQLHWILDSGRYINDNNCVVDDIMFGKAGNTINNNNYINRVDLETQLWGIDNKTSNCEQVKEVTYNNRETDKCNFLNNNQDLESNLTANLVNFNTDEKLINKQCS